MGMSNSPKITDLNIEEQLKGIRENNDAVLQHVYQISYPNVEAFVCKNNGTADEAQDIYQEAFLTMWMNVRTNKYQIQEKSSIQSYLVQIARYKWIDHLRRQKKSTVLSFDFSITEPGLIDETNEDDNQYRKEAAIYFQQLGEQCKNLLSRFYFHKQRMAEIAAAFNWTEATAKNNKYRCLEKLRTMIHANTKSSMHEK